VPYRPAACRHGLSRYLGLEGRMGQADPPSVRWIVTLCRPICLRLLTVP